MAFNLTLLPLHRQRGKDLPSLPGLLAVSPPRKTARGRDQDRLVVLLSINGSSPLTTGEYMQLTGDIASRFYQTPGSVTSALRSAADHFNQVLLERNLSTSGSGQYVVGWLVLGALRGEQFYLLQSGPTHAFHFGVETQHIHDSDLSGRGLGLSQTLTSYLSLLDLHPGDQLVLAAQVPPNWLRLNLGGRDLTSMEATQRRLLAQAGAEVSAVLIQIEPGKGELTVLRPEREPDSESALDEIPAAPGSEVQPPEVPVVETMQTESERPSAHMIGTTISDTPAEEQVTPPESQRPYPIRPQSELLPRKPQAQTEKKSFPRKTQAKSDENISPSDEIEAFERTSPGPSLSERATKGSRQAARAAAGVIRGGRSFGQKLGDALRKLTPRLIPNADSQEPMPASPSLMAGIAIIIPVLIATIGFVMYSQFGKNAKREGFMNDALEYAAQAEIESDPVAQRRAWEFALENVKLAEQISVDTASTNLREKAQGTLDALNSITRLHFQNAVIGNLPRNLNFIRLSATDTDLYMLDETSGEVLRAYLSSGRVYQYDSTFQCGPGEYETGEVRKIIDILPMPRVNQFDATVMVLDESGQLIYCAPQYEPQVTALKNPKLWEGIVAMDYDAVKQKLYVLDAPQRDLWAYQRYDEGFIEAPTYVFDQYVPTLESVVDIAVNGEDLYLLTNAGALVTCAQSDLTSVPTRCTEPATLVDLRPGRKSGPKLEETNFTQVLFAPPPDSVIFLLDTENQAIYRFSPRSLELQNQLQAVTVGDGVLPTGTITAMTLSTEHFLFVSIDGQVFVAFETP